MVDVIEALAAQQFLQIDALARIHAPAHLRVVKVELVLTQPLIVRLLQGIIERARLIPEGLIACQQGLLALRLAFGLFFFAARHLDENLFRVVSDHLAQFTSSQHCLADLPFY